MLRCNTTRTNGRYRSCSQGSQSRSRCPQGQHSLHIRLLTSHASVHAPSAAGCLWMLESLQRSGTYSQSMLIFGRSSSLRIASCLVKEEEKTLFTHAACHLRHAFSCECIKRAGESGAIACSADEIPQGLHRELWRQGASTWRRPARFSSFVGFVFVRCCAGGIFLCP